MKTRFALCVAASLAGLLGASAAANAYTAYAATDLNVRSGPGTGYRTIGVLEDGERVSVNYCEGSWCKLNGGGWASANYLEGSRTVKRVPRYSDYDNEPGIFLEFGFGNDGHHRRHNHQPHIVKPHHNSDMGSNSGKMIRPDWYCQTRPHGESCY